MGNKWIRRPVMILAVAFVAVLLPVTSPAWILIGACIDIGRRRWRLPIVRLLAFAVCWAWLELLGLAAAALLFLCGQRRRLSAFYAIQAWWCRNVVRSLRFLVGLRFEVDGVDQVTEGPLVMLGRHVSLADAVMSSWVVGTLMKRNPRYVLKTELKLDPCLDIFGHQLPNYFVDRDSADISAELQGIHEMATGLEATDVAVIFPEGSRANNVKRTSRLHSLEFRSPERYQRLRDLKHLLPPKPAGAMALLNAVPGAHVVTLAHSGLEGLDSFSAILRNFGKNIVRVRVNITCYHRSTIPSGDAFVAWLDAQWVKMDSVVQSYRMNIAE